MQPTNAGVQATTHSSFASHSQQPGSLQFSRWAGKSEPGSQLARAAARTATGPRAARVWVGALPTCGGRGGWGGRRWRERRRQAPQRRLAGPGRPCSRCSAPGPLAAAAGQPLLGVQGWCKAAARGGRVGGWRAPGSPCKLHFGVLVMPGLRQVPRRPVGGRSPGAWPRQRA